MYIDSETSEPFKNSCRRQVRGSHGFRISRLLLGACSVAVAVCHAEPVDLINNATIRSAGTYTYYAGQTSGSPSFFTTQFYPSPDSLGTKIPSDKDGKLDISIESARPVPIESGDLTDRALNGSPRLDTGVTGWNGNTSNTGNSSSAQPGFIDIVFDLGAVCTDIIRIVVNYTDSPGHRFDPTPDAQTSLFGINPPDKTSLGGFATFASATAGPDTRSGNMVFTARSPVSARYVVIRLTMLVSGSGTASAGGYINSIQIQTAPAP